MPFVTLTTEPGGPIIDVTIWVSHPREMQLRAANQPLPPVVKARALIDTGASCSLITQTVVDKLRIPVRGTTPMQTPTTDGVPQEAFRD